MAKTSASRAGNGLDVDVGDGEMPTAALFRQLETMGFAGYCNLEHEFRDDARHQRFCRLTQPFGYLRVTVAPAPSRAAFALSAPPC